MALKTASVLAFERNLDISDAFFSQLNSAENNKTIPVIVKEKTVRGTISNRLKNNITKDPAKLDAEIEKSNIQTVDSAALSEECDTLVATWSCKVLPFSGKPNVCNNQDYQTELLKTVESYIEEHGFSELAQRYATNIANARWLWRNRMGAESIEVSVKCNEESLSFDAKSMNLQNFDATSNELTKLAQYIDKGLKGEEFVILYIEAKAKIGYGQEVYPSQEFVRTEDKDKKQGKKSKVLYHVSNKAGMHSQKIANAVRTIDTWYPEAEFPIAIEPYGAVTTLGTAFRQPKQKMDFYSLFDNWVLKGEKPEVAQQHYVMGVLIRGGVFGAAVRSNNDNSLF